MKTSVVIPVYKQKDQFLTNLRANLPHLRECEIIIVNDDPSESIKGPVYEIMQQLQVSEHHYRLIEHSSNRGFAPTANDGARVASGAYIMLLNTDVTLRDESWRTVVSYMDTHTQVAAVGFAQRDHSGAVSGRNALYFKHGLFHHKSLEFHEQSEYLQTAWVEGGAGIFRTSMWRVMGGFDEKYAPFYWEDVDLGYRMQLRGWLRLFAPHVVVDHHHMSTISKHYHSDRIHEIAYAHQLYFTAKFARGVQKVQHHLYLAHSLLKKKVGK